MAADTGLVAFSEKLNVGSCASAPGRIALVNVDGTGYRVLLDYLDLQALWPTEHPSRVGSIRLSADGRCLAFVWGQFPDGQCLHAPPWHAYLVDTATAEVVELAPEAPVTGFGVTNVSMSRNAERVVYRTTEMDGHHVFLATRAVDGSHDFSSAVELLAPGDFGGIGYVARISADGRSLVFSTPELFLVDAMSEVFVMDLATGVTTRVSDKPLPGIFAVDISADGSRVVYEHVAIFQTLPGAVYAVNADGTGHHLVSDASHYGAVTITADGLWVLFNEVGEEYCCDVVRVPWGGGEREFVSQAFYSTKEQLPLAVGFGGDAYAHRRIYTTPTGLHPLTLVRFESPVLYTYGVAEVGEPLGIDVGAPAGSPYVVYMSLHDGLWRTPFGPLYLEPSRLEPLAFGFTEAPTNSGIHIFDVPELDGLAGLSVWFQAAVCPPEGGMPELTNATTITLGADGK